MKWFVQIEKSKNMQVFPCRQKARSYRKALRDLKVHTDFYRYDEVSQEISGTR